MPQAPAQRDNRQASDVANLVRLHHRRRGWAFVAAGSAIGLVVNAGIDASLPGSRTGTAVTFSTIPVFALAALAVAGLAVVIVDTSLIHRADAALQMSAKASVSHYPWYAHAHRWPPRHPGSWVAALFMLLAMTTITVYIVPQEVNAWAYVVGAAKQDTFNPVSYSTSCSLMGRHGVGCQTVTQGYLSHGGTNVIWGSQVPLDRPFSVRDPLWPWDTGRILINGDGSAIPTIIAGLFFDGIALLLLYVLVVLTRDTSPRRIQRRSTPAGADPDGLHRTHHPAEGHHGNRARRRARRGHRQRTARSR
jgi:hypothetical protein